jgi:hypothetical protein
MRRAVPTIVMVVAILQIFFGATGLLRHLCSGGMQLAGGARAFTPAGPQGVPQVDTEAVLKARVPHYELLVYGGLVLGLVSGTVCLVSGLGLLRLRPWARWLAIGYACYFIISDLAGFIYAVTMIRPVMEEVIAEQAQQANLPPQAATAFNISMKVASVAPYLTLVLLAYPILLLVVMFLPSVRAAFRGRPAVVERKDEGPDEPDEN